MIFFQIFKYVSGLPEIYRFFTGTRISLLFNAMHVWISETNYFWSRSYWFLLHCFLITWNSINMLDHKFFFHFCVSYEKSAFGVVAWFEVYLNQSLKNHLIVTNVAIKAGSGWITSIPFGRNLNDGTFWNLLQPFFHLLVATATGRQFKTNAIQVP